MDANTNPAAAETLTADLRRLAIGLDTHLGRVTAGDSVHIVRTTKSKGETRHLVQHRVGQIWVYGSDIE